MNLAEDLIVEKQTVGEIGIVKADGIVDLATMRPMREAVRGLISDGVKHLVLDLRRVSYMDSAGISVIMTAKRGVSDKHGEVYIATQPGEVQRALDLIQMNRVVRLVSTPEEAMDALTPASV